VAAFIALTGPVRVTQTGSLGFGDRFVNVFLLTRRGLGRSTHRDRQPSCVQPDAPRCRKRCADARVGLVHGAWLEVDRQFRIRVGPEQSASELDCFHPTRLIELVDHIGIDAEQDFAGRLSLRATYQGLIGNTKSVVMSTIGWNAMVLAIFSGVLVLQHGTAEALSATVIGECIMPSLPVCPSRYGVERLRSESSWGVHDRSAFARRNDRGEKADRCAIRAPSTGSAARRREVALDGPSGSVDVVAKSHRQDLANGVCKGRLVPDHSRQRQAAEIENQDKLEGGQLLARSATHHSHDQHEEEVPERRAKY
jgi:hypothetical protein